jgi:hypothetical protein
LDEDVLARRLVPSDPERIIIFTRILKVGEEWKR